MNVNNISALAVGEVTHVAYFEGYGDTLSDSDIHKKTRLSYYTNEYPAITVLVHGQGGKASHWSNDGKGNFVYDSESLIEKLRDDANGANVYLARMSKNTDGNVYDDIFQWFTYEQFYAYIPNRFFLTKLDVGLYDTDNQQLVVIFLIKHYKTFNGLFKPNEYLPQFKIKIKTLSFG